MWQQIGEVLLDGLTDTLKLFPFIFAIYVLIELIEHKTSLTSNHKILQGGFAPLIGAAAGIIPLCGFSVMAANLYDKNLIRTGTVMAVFIATSDEAVILLLSDVTNPRALAAVLPLILIKFILAVIVGYAVNLILSREKSSLSREREVVPYTCGHEEEGQTGWDIYFVAPILHALKVSLYLLAVTLVFGFIILGAGGQEGLRSFLTGDNFLQPLITSAVGLVPSCASSVAITGAFAQGGVTFGSMTAGLVVNAGMGFAILLKNPAHIVRTLLIIAAIFVIGYFTGVAVNFIQPLINL